MTSMLLLFCLKSYFQQLNKTALLCSFVSDSSKPSYYKLQRRTFFPLKCIFTEDHLSHFCLLSEHGEIFL